MADLTAIVSVLNKVAALGVKPVADLVRKELKDPTELEISAAALGVLATFMQELADELNKPVA